MGKLFYAGTLEHVVKSKIYPKDRRKKVKLVLLVDRKSVQWWYIFIGTKLQLRTRSHREAEQYYDGL